MSVKEGKDATGAFIPKHATRPVTLDATRHTHVRLLIAFVQVGGSCAPLNGITYGLLTLDIRDKQENWSIKTGTHAITNVLILQ